MNMQGNNTGLVASHVWSKILNQIFSALKFEQHFLTLLENFFLGYLQQRLFIVNLIFERNLIVGKPFHCLNQMVDRKIKSVS